MVGWVWLGGLCYHEVTLDEPWLRKVRASRAGLEARERA